MLAALRRAGVVCDSPSNPNDGSPESDLIWSISAALAKYESGRLGARLRDAHRKLARMGGGPAPCSWDAPSSATRGVRWKPIRSFGTPGCGCTRGTSRAGHYAGLRGRSTSRGCPRSPAARGGRERCSQFSPRPGKWGQGLRTGSSCSEGTSSPSSLWTSSARQCLPWRLGRDGRRQADPRGCHSPGGTCGAALVVAPCTVGTRTGE